MADMISAGCSFVLTKPIDLDKLLSTEEITFETASTDSKDAETPSKVLNTEMVELKDEDEEVI